MLYVIIQLLVAYSIIVTVTPEDTDLDQITSIFFTFYFTFFLMLGQTFTVGLYSSVPMLEKKGGLRQMMHMNGLTSYQYFSGLFMGDIMLFTAPSILISFVLLGFE